MREVVAVQSVLSYDLELLFPLSHYQEKKKELLLVYHKYTGKGSIR